MSGCSGGQLTYASGHKFMQDAARLGPDCVVLDLHMPGYSGFDVQQALAEAALDIAVVMLTGQDSPGEVPSEI